MVQLIKITSEEDSGQFTSSFQDIITVPKDGQVAVVNTTFSLGLNNVSITSLNNTLTYKRKENENLIDVSLTTGNYTKSAFLQQMKEDINSTQPLFKQGSDVVGYDIHPTVDPSSGRFNLTFGKAESIELDDSDTDRRDMAYAGSVFTSSGANGANFNYNKWVMGHLHFNNGSGEAFAQFSDNGFIGLLTTPLTNTKSVVVSDIKYGLVFNGTTYYKVVDGVSTNLTIAPNFGDVVGFDLYEGQLHFYADATSLFVVDYDFNGGGYHFASGLQNSGQTVTSMTYTPTSFTSTDGVTTLYKDTNVEEVYKVGALNATKFTMTFKSALAELLGFNRTTLSAQAIQKSFIADVLFRDSTLADSIEIQLINVGAIKSYDSVSQRMQQTIGIVPVGNALVGNKVAYSFPQPLYIDLNNDFDIPLSNLTFRVLSAESGEELIFEGGIQMTIAFKSRSEK